MISELTDEEILDFLMTSDFEDSYSPDELKYLLLKWRYFVIRSQKISSMKRFLYKIKINHKPFNKYLKIANKMINMGIKVFQ